MIAGRFHGLWFLGLVLATSCTGMLHEVSGRKSLDVATTATFNMFTNSSYDIPTADWEVVTTDENFLYYECLVERTSQVTDEVTESGVWETCESPYDLRDPAGIDVEEGFNGQLTVRAVSRGGQVGEAITKPFRRALWVVGGLWGQVETIASRSTGLILGGNTGGLYGSKAMQANGIIRVNTDGSPDLSTRSFVEGFNGSVEALVIQEDGKILVGGLFTSYNGAASASDRLIRLNSDGSVDASFSGITTGFDSYVSAVSVQPDGKILVGGNFTSYNGSAAAPDRLMRLNSDGSVDASFSGITSGFNNTVFAIIIQDDGRILVGGDFTSYNGAGGAPDRLIRLNSNGSVDSSFSGITTGFNDNVYTVSVQADGKILVGGWFTSYNGAAGAPDGLIRLNSNGSVDASFNGITSGFDGGAHSIAIQNDGQILVGGWFHSFNGDFGAPNFLIRLNSNGSVDSSFDGITSGFNGRVWAISIQADGKIFVGGLFSIFNGSDDAPDSLIRLNSNGSVDKSFTGIRSGFSGEVHAVALQEDNAILVGGNFSTYNGESESPDMLIGLNLLGDKDETFSGITTGFDTTVYVISVQSDGKILVGGDFTSYNGVSAAPDGLIRLNIDGSIDTSFTGLTTGFDMGLGGIYAVSIQDDGKILVGGYFTTYNGGAAPDSLIRLNSDGSLDVNFNGITSGFNGGVSAIAIQPDGKILVGGWFTSYNGAPGTPDSLIRLNSDGSVDASFSGITNGFDGTVSTIAIQPNGKILVGGLFTSYNGAASASDRLIRLNSDGSVDASFSGITTGFDGYVSAVSVQPDGKILVGGAFASYNGAPEVPDYFIRLNSDGSGDTSFSGNTTGFDFQVYGISLQADGKILICGEFTSYNGDPSAPDRIIRLNTDGTIDPSFMGQRK